SSACSKVSAAGIWANASAPAMGDSARATRRTVARTGPDPSTDIPAQYASAFSSAVDTMDGRNRGVRGLSRKRAMWRSVLVPFLGDALELRHKIMQKRGNADALLR